MTFRALTIMKIAAVVTFAICALVFLLLPDDSQAGKTKKGPLVTQKVGAWYPFHKSLLKQFSERFIAVLHCSLVSSIF